MVVLAFVHNLSAEKEFQFQESRRARSKELMVLVLRTELWLVHVVPFTGQIVCWTGIMDAAK